MLYEMGELAKNDQFYTLSNTNQLAVVKHIHFNRGLLL